MPFEAAVTSAPMFGRAAEPRMFQPFNVNVGSGFAGVGLQLLLPTLANSFMGQYGMVPSQFLPTQNLYDQFAAQRYHAQQQQAMALAASRDAASMQQTILGVGRAMTGRAPTLQQQQQAFGAAQDLQGILPILSMVLGPDLIDSLMGSRGSATVMAQELHRGLRTARDPVTGQLGVSGRSAGAIASQLFESMFGAGADIAAMRGMSAGQAGMLFNELNMRGMLGGDARPLASRLSQLAELPLTEGDMRRVAEQSLQARSLPVTPEAIAATQQEIFNGPTSTLGRIRDAANRGTLPDVADQLQQLPGADQLLQAGHADQIRQRLQGLSGVVSAMRDIFGDMGRPDAPMREIINGLEALTQGGLATMNPAALEHTVRTTRNLAEQSGIGIQGILGLQAQAANSADQLGLDRSLAVRAVQGAAAFSGAARDTMRLDLPTFGGLDAEQATLLDQQMRLTGAASQTGNVLSASIRMLQEGLVSRDSDAGRLAAAAMEGRTTFTDRSGRRRPVHMTDSEWLDLTAASGGDRAAAESVLSDTFMNQQYGRDFNVGDLARRLQRDVDIVPRIGGTFADALAPHVMRTGLAAELSRQGMTETQIGETTRAIGYELGQRFFQMDAPTVRDPNRRNRYMAQAFRDSVAAQIRREGLAAGQTEPEIQGRIDAATAMISDQAANEASVSMMARLGQRIIADPRFQGFRGVPGLHQMHNQATQEQQRTRLAEAQSVAQMQAAFSQLGRAGPIRRMVDALQSAQAGDDFGVLFSRAMGGVPEAAMDRLREGPLGAMLEAQQLFLGAERYTEAAARREEIDREIASRRGQSLADYRQTRATATGEARTRLDAEHARLTNELTADPAFQERVRDAVRIRAGSLTEAGVQQRNTAASAVEGLSVGGAAATRALEAVAAQEGVAVGGLTTEFFQARIAAAPNREERERLERIQRVAAGLRAAQTGATGVQALERAGFATGVSIGESDVRSVAQIGAEAGSLQQALTPLPAGADAAARQRFEQEQQRVVDSSARFLAHTRDMAETLQASAPDMAQLGAGGVQLVQGLQADERQLAALATTAGVTPGQLLAGRVGAEHQAAVAQARALQRRLVSGWERISEIKRTGVRAGEPGSLVQAAGAHETAVAAETAAFLTNQAFMPERRPGGPALTPEEVRAAVRRNQADAATRRLVGALSPDQQALFVDAGSLTPAGQEIARTLLSTERTVPVAQALSAREQLVRIAAEQGISVGGAAISVDRLDRLSGSQRQEAIDNLLLQRAVAAGVAVGGAPLTAARAAALTPAQRQQAIDAYLTAAPENAAGGEIRRLMELQEPLRGVGAAGDVTLESLRRRVEGFAGAARGPGDTMTASAVKLSGTVRIVNPETLQIAGDLQSDGGLDHNGVITNLIGAVGGIG